MIVGQLVIQIDLDSQVKYPVMTNGIIMVSDYICVCLYVFFAYIFLADVTGEWGSRKADHQGLSGRYLVRRR